MITDFPTNEGSVLPGLSPLFSKAVRPILTSVNRARVSQLEALPTTDVDLLFIGDSITEQGYWGEWYSGWTTANRGVGGDRIEHVLARRSSFGHGRQTFVMIGTNDLAYGRTPAEVAAGLDRVLDLLRDTDLYVYSVLPRKAAYTKLVKEVNERYRKVAARHGATYIDLWPAFATPEGTLRPEFTNDMLHLNGPGYRAWIDVLTPYVRPHA